MLNIEELMEARLRYSMGRVDEWIEEINRARTKKALFFIVPETYFQDPDREQIDRLSQKYHIAGIFDLSTIAVWRDERMILIHAVSDTIDTVKISLFTPPAYTIEQRIERNEYSESSQSKPLTATDPKNYTKEFKNYLVKLKTWIKREIRPRTHIQGRIEYHAIPTEILDIYRLYPNYYSKNALRIRELAKNQPYAKLSDVADIITPKENPKKKTSVKQILPGHFPSNLLEYLSPPLLKHYLPYQIENFPSFSFDEGNLRIGEETNSPLKKGDIVTSLKGKKRFYLHQTETKEEIHVAKSILDIYRVKTLSPEYLYLYLHSETAAIYINTINKDSAPNRREAWKNISEIPVPIPNFPNKYYQYVLHVFSEPQTRHYTHDFIDITKKIKEISTGQKEAETIEELFNVELMKNLQICTETLLNIYFQNEMDELNSCIFQNADKKTIIMAASILETLLKDWLSEIDGVDYFASSSIKIDESKSEIRNPNLSDYIKAVHSRLQTRNIPWDTEYQYATEISEVLKEVQGTLSLHKKILNRNICNTIIRHLKEIILSRGLEIL